MDDCQKSFLSHCQGLGYNLDQEMISSRREDQVQFPLADKLRDLTAICIINNAISTRSLVQSLLLQIGTYLKFSAFTSA